VAMALLSLLFRSGLGLEDDAWGIEKRGLNRVRL